MVEEEEEVEILMKEAMVEVKTKNDCRDCGECGKNDGCREGLGSLHLVGGWDNCWTMQLKGK